MFECAQAGAVVPVKGQPRAVQEALAGVQQEYREDACRIKYPGIGIDRYRINSEWPHVVEAARGSQQVVSRRILGDGG